MIVETYIASGGDSALLHVDQGWEVRAEAHQDSFALVWPAVAPLRDILELLGAEAEQAAVLVGFECEAPRELTWNDARSALRFSHRRVDFARVELDRLVLTWTRIPRNLPVVPGNQDVHELGIGAEVLDHGFLVRLIRGSAVEALRETADALVGEAHRVLSAVPTGKLYDTE